MCLTQVLPFAIPRRVVTRGKSVESSRDVSLPTLAVVPLAKTISRPVLSLFVAVPAGEAQLGATVELGSEVFDLRFYGSEEMLVPAWWIGVFDSSGELRKTAVSPRPDLSPIDLTLWLRPIVGLDAAEELVRLIAEAVARKSTERQTADARR